MKMNIDNKYIYTSVYNDWDYRTIISYIKEKCPEMVRAKHKISWKYKITSNRLKSKFRRNSMWATVVWDRDRKEPIAFAGFYIQKSQKYGQYGHAIVVYVNPNYRRQGILSNMITLQEAITRKLGLQYVYSVQLNGNIELSKKRNYEMVSPGRMTNDGTYSQVRFMCDGTTPEAIQRYEDLKAKGIVDKEESWLKTPHELGLWKFSEEEEIRRNSEWPDRDPNDQFYY